MSERTVAGERARQACVEMPDLPTRSIAGYLMEHFPSTFKDYEHARRLARYYRGESGKRDRGYVTHAQSKAATIKFESPPSDAKPPTPYQWTTTGSGLMISDVHIPFHDPRALDTSINYAISRGLTDYLILLGDISDHYQLSRWCVDPEQRAWSSELEMTRDVLRQFSETFGTVVYKLGNHERRYDIYMRTKAPELLGVKHFQWPAVMELEQYGIDYVAWNAPIHVGGHLTLLHGHEFGGSVYNPVNPARGLTLRARACGVCGHHHQSSQHSEPDVRGRSISTWSLGCLCDLHPEYLPYNRWNHGFGVLHFAGGENWEIENRRLVKGQVR